MILMFGNGFMDRLKHGVGVEGERTWKHGPRCTSKCPHSEHIVAKWVAKFILYFTWDHDLCAFDLQDEILEIALEDIYFIVGFSQWGAPVNLEGTNRGSDLLSI